MRLKQLEKRIQGWFPKEPSIAYAHRSPKPRWRRPVWVALSLVAVVALAFFAYRGAQILVYYTNPQADITAAYFGKALNCSTAKVGDTVEVSVYVYWHGHVVPEFKRQVEIVDPYPESNFQLVSGNNTIQYSGMGGYSNLMYWLKVVSDIDLSTGVSEPKLYLDNTEIHLEQARN